MVTDRLSLVAAHGLLIAVISLAMEHRLQALRLQKPLHVESCRPGIEPMSPALAGGSLINHWTSREVLECVLCVWF